MSDISLRVGKCTSIGYYRDNNEDRLFVDEQRLLFIVADGMGGQAAGEQASQLAVDMIPQQLASLHLANTDDDEIRMTIIDAVVAANEAILARGVADPSVQNMGTTVVMAIIRGLKMYIAHLGDSRAYRLRDGQCETLTSDHNLAQALYEAKTISKEELRTHRFKNMLWKYLGCKEAEVGPDIKDFDFQPGDRFVLATDGLTGVIDDESLTTLVYQYDSPQTCSEQLVKYALDNGSKDNITCVVLYVDPQPAPPGS